MSGYPPIWTIETKSTGDIAVAGILESLPTIATGTEVSILVRVETIATAGSTGETGGTFGTSSGFTYGGSGGALYGSLENSEPAAALEPYAELAGRVATGVDIDGKPYYREQLPSSASIDSLLLGVKPPQGSSEAGFWGVLTGASDESPRSFAIRKFDLSVFMLGQYGDYADRADVEATHKK
jgi:hypothetical protein